MAVHFLFNRVETDSQTDLLATPEKNAIFTFIHTSTGHNYTILQKNKVEPESLSNHLLRANLKPYKKNLP